MRSRRLTKCSLIFCAAFLVGLPTVCRATTYTDESGDEYGDDYVDIQSVVVTNDSSNIDFLINLRSTSQIASNTNEQWGKYEIAFQTGAGGSTDITDPWGLPDGISTGMNYWVGAWANQDPDTAPPNTGGAALYQYSGGSWAQTAGIGTDNPYVPVPVTLTDTSVEINIPLASLGLSGGSTFNFDVWTTYSGDAVFDALDSGSAATLDPNYMPWNGSSYDAATAAGSTFASTTYTVTGSTAPPTLSWNNTGGSGDGATWDTANQNFNDGTNPAVYADGAAVVFNDNNNGHYAVSIPSLVSPSSVTVDNSSGDYVFTGAGGIGGSASLIKAGTGKLTISAPLSYTGATTISAGELSLATNLTSSSQISVAAGATLQLQKGAEINTATLSLADGSTLDITTNSETFDTTVAGHDAATLLGLLQASYDKGHWDLPGITSSTAAASGGINTLGYSDSGSTFTIVYTLPGDTDLNGVVNSADLTNLNNRDGWDDFNYDGVVNADDYALFTLGALFSGSSSGSSTVPEPAGAMLLIAAIPLWATRRRRKPE